jgi:hypothetical protein
MPRNDKFSESFRPNEENVFDLVHLSIGPFRREPGAILLSRRPRGYGRK